MNQRTVMLALVTVSVAVVAAVWWLLSGDLLSGKTDDASVTPAPSPSVSAASASSSPSATTASATPRASASAMPEPTAFATPAPDLIQGDVFVTYAGIFESGDLEASAYLDVLDPSPGTCTLHATQGSTAIAAAVVAIADASTTTCGLISIDGATLTKGTWTVVVEYKSATFAGMSEEQEVVVP